MGALSVGERYSEFDNTSRVKPGTNVGNTVGSGKPMAVVSTTLVRDGEAGGKLIVTHPVIRKRMIIERACSFFIKSTHFL
jgi:hypothetical protein